MSDLRTSDILTLLVTLLAGAAGGTPERWRGLIGPVKMLPIAMNIHCNWSVSPIATGDELASITKAIEIVRAEHPYVIG